MPFTTEAGHETSAADKHTNPPAIVLGCVRKSRAAKKFIVYPSHSFCTVSFCTVSCVKCQRIYSGLIKTQQFSPYRVSHSHPGGGQVNSPVFKTHEVLGDIFQRAEDVFR